MYWVRTGVGKLAGALAVMPEPPQVFDLQQQARRWVTRSLLRHLSAEQHGVTLVSLQVRAIAGLPTAAIAGRHGSRGLPLPLQAAGLALGDFTGSRCEPSAWATRHFPESAS